MSCTSGGSADPRDWIDKEELAKLDEKAKTQAEHDLHEWWETLSPNNRVVFWFVLALLMVVFGYLGVTHILA